MTATNFRELLKPAEHFKASDGVWSIRFRTAEELLARPVPWVDCPTCDALGWVGGPTPDGTNPCDTCPACTGTGKATVAQLLAWGQAVAETVGVVEWGVSLLPHQAVDAYRNQILDVQP